MLPQHIGIIRLKQKENVMPYYCVNRNAQSISGDHEVHDLTPGACSRLPNLENRIALGWHLTCHTAVAQAKAYYPTADGCFWCCSACHTS